MRSPPLDTAALWLPLAGIYWVMLVMAMHFPGQAIPEELRPTGDSDGLFHCVAYFGFAFVICRAFEALHRRRYPTVNPPMLVYLFIFLLCVTYGYIDEETQPWTGRTNEAGDLEADALGSLFGVCAHLFVTVFFTTDPAQLVLERWQRRRRKRHRSRRHRSRRHGSGHHSSRDASASDHEDKRLDEHGHRHRRRRRSRSADTHDETMETKTDIPASDIVDPEASDRAPDAQSSNETPPPKPPEADEPGTA